MNKQDTWRQSARIMLAVLYLAAGVAHVFLALAAAVVEPGRLILPKPNRRKGAFVSGNVDTSHRPPYVMFS